MTQEKASKTHPGSSVVCWASLTDANTAPLVQEWHLVCTALGFSSQTQEWGRRNVRAVPQHSQGLLREPLRRGSWWSQAAPLGWAVSAPWVGFAGAEPQHLRALGFTCGIPDPSLQPWSSPAFLYFSLWKISLFSSNMHKNIVESSTHCQGCWCFQFAARDQGRHPIISNFLLRCSKMSTSA